MTHEETAMEIARLAEVLKSAGRNDLLLRAIGVSTLEDLRLEAARVRLSRLLITRDYRFLLLDYHNQEIDLQPVHKAVYLLFLSHPEGIEFKRLSEYREELRDLYKKTSGSADIKKIDDGVEHLINPLDNAINEKCSRIKRAFHSLMDEYTANYYIISGHVKKRIAGSEKVWYERLKIINLPRELVVYEGAI
jgi:hypothetical protein